MGINLKDHNSRFDQQILPNGAGALQFTSVSFASPGGQKESPGKLLG